MHFQVVYILLAAWEVLVTKILLGFSIMSFLFLLFILVWQIIRRILSDKLVVLLVYVVLIADSKAEQPLPKYCKRLFQRVISIFFLDILYSLFIRLKSLSKMTWQQLVQLTNSLQSKSLILQASTSTQLILMDEMCQNFFSKISHISVVILLWSKRWRLLSTSSQIMLVLLIKAIRQSFFLPLKAVRSMDDFRSSTAKLSSINVAQTEYRFGRNLLTIDQLQFCCWSLLIV